MATDILRLPVTPISRPKWPNNQFQRYVVGWADLGIIKVGCTSNGRARWGPFLARGAVMIDLACYECAVDAEVRLDKALREFYRPAFRNKQDAKEILGSGGAGYLECLSVPVSEWAHVARLALEA